MRIAFYNILGEPKNGERETLLRMQSVFLKQGHEFLVLDREGYVISNGPAKGKFVENANVDVMFTCDPVEFALVPLPDVFSVFAHWAPIGFFENFRAQKILESFHLYDHYVCSGETEVLVRVTNCSSEEFALFGPSVPVGYTIKPRIQEERRLFYVGINFERSLANMRYGELLYELDRSGKLEIYGPQKVYGKKNLWAGFRSYRGEIPFDGHSIISKINRAGVCLALNSPMHNDANMVTSRTYEGAAAGAVIISDDNDFVREHFGDSVFYIPRDASEKAASQRILKILEWVNRHPQKAYEMACRSQQAFLDHLSLDTMVFNFAKSAERAIERLHDIRLQSNVIDVICYVDKEDDQAAILSQLQRQYYQNLHLIFVAAPDVRGEMSAPYPYDVVEGDIGFRGQSFLKVQQYLYGKYFMFIDGYSVLHARHIYKSHEVLSGRDELFAYSGCYLRNSGHKGRQYIAMNNKPILQNEFLAFSGLLDGKDQQRLALFIETVFTRSAGLFRHEILDYTNEEELTAVSDNVHMYLACCSLIKANRKGRFTYALTTGYSGNSVLEVERSVFGRCRRTWYSDGRLEGTYVEELRSIFFPYSLEYGVLIPNKRQFDGEAVWYSDL